MQSLLPRFYFTPVQIIAQIVAKRPHEGNNWIRVFQAKEVFAAYPAIIIIIFPVETVNEELRTHRIDVVNMDMLIFASCHGIV